VIAVFLACFVDWLPYLAPGERGTIMVIAADKRQARSALGSALREVLGKSVDRRWLGSRLDAELSLGSVRQALNARFS
jgi:hypothetical protein